MTSASIAASTGSSTRLLLVVIGPQLVHQPLPARAGPSRRRVVAGRRRDRDAAALEHADELLLAARHGESGLRRDDALADELGETVLHRLHAALRRRLHDGVDLLDLALADQVPDGVVREEDLEARDAAEAVGGRQQGLRDDALERVRELHAHLLLLRGREDVDDAVDRARRALGVERREDEVAGLGGGERGRDRLEVAHLAEEDHVGVLAQRRAQRLAEASARRSRSRAA